MSAWVSLQQQWLMTTWNVQTYRRLQFWPKNLLQCYRSKDKIPELWKSLYREDFTGRICITLLNFTPLQPPDVFYNHASRSQKGKILRWNKHAGQQADLASQCSECSLPANKWKTKGQNAHSSWSQYDPRSRKACSTLNSSVLSKFHLFGFF